MFRFQIKCQIVEKEEVGPSFDNVKVGIPVDVRIPEAKVIIVV
jgi:hypothetical protein